jgi:hypothetical protein
MNSLKQVLMNRDGLTSAEADEQILNARRELMQRIEDGEMPFDFCEEEWGLEPDYLEDLM